MESLEGCLIRAKPKEYNKIIFILLDVSGSMRGEEEALAKGVNDVLSTLLSQKKEEDKISVSIDTFNNHMQQLVPSFVLNSDGFTPLNATQFAMDGDTALYDAIGKNLKEFHHLTTPLKDVVLVVGTDGNDTCSSEFDASSVRELVMHYKKEGVSFIFIAAGEEAYAAGELMGFTHKECKQVGGESESVGTGFSSQLIRDAISQAMGFMEEGKEEDYPSEFDKESSPKRIKSEVYSQDY